MEIIDVIRACIRRWYVVLPLLALTAWFSYSYYSSIKPVYYANAVVGAAPPNQQVPFSPDGRPVPRNGLLDIGGAELIMNLVVLSFDDPHVKEQVTAAGGKGNFSVRMFPSTPGAAPQQLPLILVEATEPDPASAVKTVELAAAQTNSILTDIQRQAGVPDSEMLRAIQASHPNAIQGTPSRNKSFLVIVMFGAGLSILLGLAFDAIVRRLGKAHRNHTNGASADQAVQV